MLPNLPVKLGFNMKEHPQTKDVWENDLARKIWLLWKPCHLVNDDFIEEVFTITHLIETKKPTTLQELISCFQVICMSGNNFTRSDVEVFCQDAYKYLMDGEDVPVMFIDSKADR